MEGQIIISNALADKMNIPLKPYVYVRAGARIIKAQLEISYDPTECYKLSPQLEQALLLQAGTKLQIRYDTANDMLHVGPTIGILTAAIPRREDYDASSTQAELIYLSNIGKTMQAQVYIFTPQSIDWENHCTKGYVYKAVADKWGIWESAVYPLPDVVYDRISSRKAESRSLIKTTKRKLLSLPELKYFNQSFFNKWRVYEILRSNITLVPYLPETRVLNQNNLQEMLARYNVLYVKPANGSLGKGIIKVVNRGDGKILYTTYVKSKQNGSIDNALQFMEKTRSIRQKRNYIVQQGIDLAKYKEASFDIRIIYQKNGEGKWLISKKFIRVAARGSSISNLSRGGRAEQSKTVLAQVLNKNKRLIEVKNHEMKFLCESVANTLEKASQSILGELGLDIGIDQRGKLWIIEVNSKPRKTTETEMSKTIVKNTFKRPLDYAAYLSGFSNTKKKPSYL